MLRPEDVKPFAQHGEFDTKEIREDVAGYYNAVKRVDIGVGLLMNMLDRIGQADNTLVIFIGDHGLPCREARRRPMSSARAFRFWSDGRRRSERVRNMMISFRR